MTDSLVYLAGSAAELERCRHWHSRLIQAGITVVSTWIASVTRVGCSNPRDAAVADRLRWSETCLIEVRRADVLWLLVPSVTAPTRGAWVELGYASAIEKRIVLSGDTRQSIFTALGDEHETDEQAFAAITN